MRQAGTIANEADAQRFADYLLTQGITARADPAGDAWAIWIREESQVDQAAHELAAFMASPHEPRYTEAARAATALRKQTARKQAEVRHNYIDARRMWDAPSGRRPLTFFLIGLCILVAIWSRLGESTEVANQLMVVPYPQADDLDPRNPAPWLANHFFFIEQGQIWRLITPIFLHDGPMHLVFNLFWLFDLGSLIEVRRGTWRLAGLVLLAAVLSNSAQAYFGGPWFGGMSGVVCALFGYVWMKSRYQPHLQVFIHQNTVVFMLIFLVLCTFGWIGRIANWAHFAGLAVGVVVGYAPILWRNVRRRLRNRA